ncbi:MAG: hypothetical protein WAW15_00930 [Minisyncoccales bacterium]
MFKSKKIKLLICSFFYFLIILLPLGNVMAADPIENITNLWFMGPTAIPAGILVTGLDFLDLLPKTEEKGSIGDPVGFVFSGIARFGYTLLYTACTALITLGQSLLTYVIDGNFTGMSITDFDSGSPTYNPIVAEGWGIVRNVANAALIIGLVVIAINIILGREENKAKGMLVNFIIIALLINFTPVLCGLLIDASNGITKSFITGGINQAFSSEILSSFSKVKGETTDSIQLMFAGIIFLIFSLVSFFIYTLYAILFAARYIILWILVIASPIALATRVFPQSKYVRNIFPSILYWDDWIQSFAQWCTIGIPAGLFIYLSNMMMSLAQTTPTTTTDSGDIVAGLIGGLLKYLIPLLFLVAGFFISISAGGQVGSFVGGVATGAWAKTGGRAIKGTKEWAEGRAAAAGSYVKEGALGVAGTMAMRQDELGRPLSILSKEDRAIGRQGVAGWTKRVVQETPLKYLTNPPALEKDKDAAMDNYNKNWNRYSIDDRQKIEKTLMDKDMGAFLKGAENNPKEYQRRLSAVSSIGGEKAKFDAYLHASGNLSLVGSGGLTDVNKWAANNKIDVTKKMQSLGAKDAKDKIGAEAIKNNPEILKNMGSKIGINIMQQGSEEQRKAMKEMTIGKNKDFRDYLLQQSAIIHNPASSPDDIEKAKANADRGLRLVGEIYKNS